MRWPARRKGARKRPRCASRERIGQSREPTHADTAMQEMFENRQPLFLNACSEEDEGEPVLVVRAA